MQYKIPQDVQKQDKIIWNFTLQQFLYLLSGAVVGYISFSITSKIAGSMGPGLAIGFIFFVSIASFAVIEIQGMPLPQYIVALILFSLRPRKRVWQKDIYVPDIAYVPPKKEAPKEVPIVAKSDLEKLAYILDTRGWGELAEKEETEEIEVMYKKMGEETLEKPKTKEDLKFIEKALGEAGEKEKIQKELPSKIAHPVVLEKAEEEPQKKETEKGKLQKIEKVERELESENKLLSEKAPAPAPQPKKPEIKKPEPEKQKGEEVKENKEETPPKTKEAIKKKTEEIKVGIEGALQKEIERELKRQKLIKEELAKTLAELKPKIQKELKEKKVLEKESLNKLKDTVSDIEKIVKKPAPKKVLLKKTEVSLPPVLQPKPQAKKPPKEKPVIPVVDEYKIDLKNRITTPRVEKPTTNIKINEKELEDILEDTERIKNIKKELEEVKTALVKQTRKKKKPRIIKESEGFME